MGSASAGVGSALPSQDGFSGYVLTTDGVVASWEPSSASLPSQVGNSGKYLTTNGTAAAWGVVTADSLLPSQTGKSGQVLSTNGTTVAWASASGVSLGAFSSTPSSGGLTLSGTALNMDPADGTNPGGVSATTQAFKGAKTFNDGLVATGVSPGAATGLSLGNVSSYYGLWINQATPSFTNYAVMDLGGGTTGINAPTSLELLVANGVIASVISYNSVPSIFLAAGSTLAMTGHDSTGTPGDATIVQACGMSSIDTSATACVITNSLATAGDICLVMPLTINATAVQLKAVCGSSTITVTANAAATVAPLQFAWVLIKTNLV